MIKMTKIERINLFNTLDELSNIVKLHNLTEEIKPPNSSCSICFGYNIEIVRDMNGKFIKCIPCNHQRK